MQAGPCAGHTDQNYGLMVRPPFTIILLMAAVFPAVASAQSVSDEMDITARPWADQAGFAGITTLAVRSGSWSANRFYAVTVGEWPDSRRHWVIRRAHGDRHGPNAGEIAVVWADSRTCPAVERALVRMEAMPPFMPDAPGLGREDDRWSLTFDGVHHRFWSRVKDRSSGRSMDITVEGNAGTPIERWWSRSLVDLESCWSPTEPVMP